MQKIKTLIVDDEFLALNLLENFIQKVPELTIIDKVKTPLKALEVLQQHPIDLLFLDIQMPIMSGNNLLRSIPDPPVTIFTTAYAEYAIEAFDLSAVDYLLKPFSFQRFLEAVQKAKASIQSSSIHIPTQSKDFFTAKVDGRLIKVQFDSILYIEGLKEYVRIVCKEGRYVTLESLKNLEALLPHPAFLRVHKSFIVAKKQVQALNGNMLEIGKQHIPISRSKREEVIQEIFYR